MNPTQSVLRTIPEDLNALWSDALAAAGFQRDEVELLLVPSDAHLNPWGLHLAPGDPSTNLGPEMGFSPELLTEIDRLDPDKHRIIVFVGEPRLPAQVILALMRHELRHAEQNRHNNDCYRVGLLATRAHRYEFEGTGYGATSLGRGVPHEQDADSAAVAIVGEVDDASAIRNGNFRGLLTQDRPLEELDGLRPRTVAFLALHPYGFAKAAADICMTPKSVLDLLGPSASASYAAASSNEALSRLRACLNAAVPREDAIVAAGERPADAWHAAQQKLDEAQRLAEKLVHDRWANPETGNSN